MGVSQQDLFTKFARFDAEQTGAQVLQTTAEYVVIDFGDGKFIAVALKDLSAKLDLWKKWGGLDTPIRQFHTQNPGALQPHFVESFDINDSSPALDAKINAMRDGQILVALENGTVIGLLIKGVTERGGGTSKGRFVLSAEDELESAGAAPDEANAPEKRFINAEIEDHDKEKPLKMSELYTLAFWLDADVNASSIIRREDAVLNVNKLFAGGESEVDLTIQLQSNDFKIEPEERTMRVPRKGPTRKKVRFDIEPLHEGEGTIQAIFLKNGNFIQVITIKLFTGELFSAKTLGRNIDAAFSLNQPRDVNLIITESIGGFQMVLAGAVGAIASLPITLPQLDAMIAKVRKQLLEIVHLENGGRYFYQQGIDIQPDVRDFTLKKLANAGANLYEQLFYGPGHDMQANLMGDKLREMARKHTLKIQIFSQRFTFPWGLLYIGEDADSPEPEMFLGLKHIIEHIPLQPQMQVTDQRIDKSNGLAVSLNVNTDIDAEMGVPLIREQLEYWQQIKEPNNVKLEVRRSADDVLNALKKETTPDQILYFYCHAISRTLGEKEGPDSSVLVFAGKRKLTLEDLRANQRKLLNGSPLVFINACESAELSPMFYDGFVPYFMAKGARGVIGTECETPALFAVEWSKRFFERFLKGEPVGKVFLELRREFFFKHNNMMGLLYALYVDGDTCIATA